MKMTEQIKKTEKYNSYDKGLNDIITSAICI